MVRPLLSKSSQRIDDGVATVRQQLRGDLSGTWLVTGGTVLFVNGVTLWTLGSLNFVAGFEPASDDGTTAVWCPHNNDWEGTTWKLTALERWSIKSRWTATGAGRSDVRATGGDLSSPVTVNECWDTTFRSTFLDGSEPSQVKWGVESTDCAFIGASYSTR